MARRDEIRDLGGLVCAALFILGGCLALWDTTQMVDADSYVFPRAVAIAMIVFSIAFIVWNFVHPATEGLEAGPGSTPRRIGLVLTMLGCAVIMPYTGFVIAGAAAFFILMVIAMYEKWTHGRLVVYPLVCLAVVFGFYALFAKALLVPLPETPFL